MTHKVAIIGDQFMLPDTFERHLRERCGDAVVTRSMANGWPDELMEHGYARAGMDGLKEYIGDADAVCEFVGDAEILVTHLAPMSAAMFKRLPALKLIAVSRGGPVNIDMQAAQAAGVKVVNAPGRNASAVAEFTIGAILCETRRIRLGHETLRAGIWRGDLYRADRTGRELHEMTVGLIGYGEIGRRVVKLLQPFGCKILVADPYVELAPEDKAAGVAMCTLDELLPASDIVSLHARVTPETQHIINAGTLEKMRSDSVLINTARGPLVDYPALTHALQNQVIGAAMLETFDVEPPDPAADLLQLPNVTLTPHIAGASVYTIDKACAMVAEEVRRFINNEPALNAC